MSDLDHAVVAPATEAEAADWRRSQGRSVIRHEGRHWERIGPGFYQPVALLQAIDHAVMGAPAPFALGYRAALPPSMSGAANGSVPAYLLHDPAGFDLGRLPQRRRTRVRKGLREARFELLTDPVILLEQGYEVAASALRRTAERAVPSREAYNRQCVELFRPGHVVIAGFIDGRLAGYIAGYAIGDTGYGSEYLVSTSAMSSCVGNGLLYHMIRTFGRSSGIGKVMNGLHVPDKPSLDAFKRDFGFQLERVPALVHVRYGVAPMLKLMQPFKYYRFTGIAVPSTH